MVKKETSFFEEHIEKIVLIIVGIIAAGLLVLFVIVSPVKISYEQRKFSPSAIDALLKEKADEIQIGIEGPPRKKEDYKPKREEFLNMIASAVTVDNELFPTIPDNIKSIGEQPKYGVPDVSGLKDSYAEYIRAVAYVPKTEVTLQKPYSYMYSEPNDIDLVTVEAKFDVTSLYQSFVENFTGQNIKDEWRDEKLAVPVFAAVNLQRQQRAADGSWSDWQDVPRAKIDPYRKKIEIIENVNELPQGSMDVRLLEFKDKNVQTELLQPQAYQIASADEEWLPPLLHRRFKKIQADLKQQRERAEAERDRTTRTAAGRGNTPRGNTPAEMSAYMRGVPAGGPGIMPPVPPTTTTPKDSPELRAVYDEFNKLLITDKTDLGKMKEPLLIWAYDDTVKPNNSYRYRIRLGVLNPIAGTDKLQDSENPLKDKAILWTDFVEAPEIIEVPGRTCFFAKDIQEAEKKVTVTIYRYTLGSWYGSDFYVRPGDLIGKNVVLESAENEEPQIGIGMINPFQIMNTKPKNVDYSTGAVVVDALKVNAWTGTSKIYQRSYHDMLYSFDGTEITHMPVGSANWPSQLSILYNNIKTLEKEPKQPFKPWSDRTARRTPQQTQPTTPMITPGYEEMMMRIIQGQGRIN